MDNPENFRIVHLCVNCDNKEPYITGENKTFYSCPVLDDDDIELSYYCGKHQEINNSDSYQITACCYNCFEFRKMILKNDISYECMFYSGPDGNGAHSLESTDGKCDFYRKQL